MQIRTSRDIGSLIRARRSGLGWDQQTFADRIGVSRLWVGEIERGKPGAKLDLILRALAALDVTLRADDPGQAPGPTIVRDHGAGKSRSAALIGRLLDGDRE